MKRLIPLCFILLTAILYPGYGKDCSPWIKAKLDSVSASYTVTEDGEFKWEYPVEFAVDGRTQLVFINSKSKDFLSEEVLEIWSPVYSCDGALSPEIANMLLADNAEHLVGSWEVKTSSSGISYVLFKAVCEVETIKKMFPVYIFYIASTADELEKALTGNDRY